MRKIAALLIFALIIIFSAGCVSQSGTTQSNNDPLIGTWETIEPQYVSDTVYYTSVLKIENSGETLTNKYSDGTVGEFRIVWAKATENVYVIHYFNSFKLSPDGKTMTSNNGETFTGGNGFTGRWIQNIDKSAGYHFECVFNEDGSGSKYLYLGGKVTETPFICTEEVDGYLYEFMYLEELTISNGKMTDSSGRTYTLKNGVWSEDKAGKYAYCTFVFDESRTGTRTVYNSEGVVSSENTFDWKQRSETARDVFYHSDLMATINSDGTLTLQNYDSKFKKL
ncbi:MAG: hypothetical protein Q4Q53_06025 [Methanocorpusculum sp.]|nr:hypothetical protein [Methanocorpusculum sp.]